MARAYIPMTEADRQEMLAVIGASSIEEFYADIPASALIDTIDLPPALSELELGRELQRLAARNKSAGELAFFRGGGIYRHFSPTIVSEMLRRGEFLTSYTPYQAEASQGTLQAAFEFQSMLCTLTGMEVANAGMYDAASALAEACLMACRVTRRERIVLHDSINPRHVDVVRTYVEPQGIAVERYPSETSEINDQHACFAIQSPDFYGRILLKDATTAEACHAAGALLVVSADPMSLALLRPAGELGADIVVGEGQALGLPMSFGGPYVGLFATKQEHLRQMPGRLVGQTTDSEGQRAFVLTLQAREQHIRRERASSNICTSEQLLALAVAVYLASVGSKGLQTIARLCYDKAHYAAERIQTLPGWRLSYADEPFFHEFVVEAPLPAAAVSRGLRERGIVGGIDVSQDGVSRMLLCVTETNSRDEIDALVTALAEIGGAE